LITKKKLIKKFIIGSANFYQKYGADSIKIKKKEIEKILELSLNYNINKIDTAHSYIKKNSFFKKISDQFEFITKLKPNKHWISKDYSQKNLQIHMQQFKNHKVDTLMFHDVDILFKKNGEKIFQNFEVFKKKYFKKIGVSIYDLNSLGYLLDRYNVDVVQCPYNIIDKRLITSGWYETLKKRKIETHVRSVFLQGLLVNRLVYKKKYFKKWKQKFSEWFDYIENKNLSPIDYCLSDLLNFDFDKVVIGINNYNHLNEILNFKKVNLNNNVLNFKKNDLKLIDPRNWK